MHPQPTYPAGRAYSESRIAVDDGYIWPFPRAQMVTPGTIRERMIEDIARAVNDGGDAPCVTLDDLRRCGWTQAQVETHGERAFEAYKAKKRVTQAAGALTRRDTPAQIAASALASVIFVASLALWAGHATGAL